MPTLGLMVEDTIWVNIVDELSLVIGTTYFIQNISDSEVLFAFKETSPIDSDPFHVIFPSL